MTEGEKVGSSNLVCNASSLSADLVYYLSAIFADVSGCVVDAADTSNVTRARGREGPGGALPRPREECWKFSRLKSGARAA